MALVQRNIEVDLEVWNALKYEATNSNKNVREFIGEILTDYVKTSGKTPEAGGIKAIIIAAGLGSRLRPLTDNKPKCMLKINEKTLIERQIETFRKCGIDDIIIVKGYKKNLINYSGVKYYINRDYRNNNILESLMYAKKEMTSEFIASYSDIWYDEDIVKKLMNSKADISLIVDTNWISHYKERYQHPIEEAEKVAVENNRVVRVSKIINPNEAHGEFIGLAKFSRKGAEILKREYAAVKKELQNKPFQTAASVEKAYLTDMIQELIDRGYEVINVDIRDKWIEIDTLEDYERAQKVIK